MTCAPCFEPLYAPDRCVHRQRYLDATTYVISRGIRVYSVDYEWWAWQGGRSGKNDIRFIEISSVAYKLYGWDVMTSVLVHEFGHCDLFNEGIGQGSTAEEKLKIEKMATQRGVEVTPLHLVPEQYHRHREFFLKSYLQDDWTEDKCRAEWRLFRDTLWTSTPAIQGEHNDKTRTVPFHRTDRNPRKRDKSLLKRRVQ
jgi:hypothetical protein